MASRRGLMGQDEFATYNASKGALLTMTKCMALDLAPYKIRVNSVCPGCILTSASYREIERLGLTFEQWRRPGAPPAALNRVRGAPGRGHTGLVLRPRSAQFRTPPAFSVGW